MSTEPTLEIVTEDDWELWRELRHRCLAHDPDAFGSTLELEQSYTEDEWRARMRRGRMVLARLGGEPVAIGGVFDETPELAWVVSMWTAPEARGRGIGRLVLDDVVAHVPAEVDLRLWVSEGNGARRLYERAGFVPTGRVQPLRDGSPILKHELRRPSTAV